MTKEHHRPIAEIKRELDLFYERLSIYGYGPVDPAVRARKVELEKELIAAEAAHLMPGLKLP